MSNLPQRQKLLSSPNELQLLGAVRARDAALSSTWLLLVAGRFSSATARRGLAVVGKTRQRNANRKPDETIKTIQ